MRLLIDTSILIDHLRGDPRATSFLSTALANRGDLWSITPVRTEVLAGMRPIEEAPTMALFTLFHWQEVTSAVADRAGALARCYLKSHPGIDTVDYLLAAAAELLGARLCTTNVRHFPMIPSLKPPY